MWPMTGSMALRRRRSRRMVGVMPRFWPERTTRALVGVVAAVAAVDVGALDLDAGDALGLGDCSARVWPS